MDDMTEHSIHSMVLSFPHLIVQRIGASLQVKMCRAASFILNQARFGTVNCFLAGMDELHWVVSHVVCLRKHGSSHCNVQVNKLEVYR